MNEYKATTKHVRLSKVWESAQLRLMLTLMVVAVYVSSFIPLYHVINTGVAALSVLPVGVAGSLLGVRAGLLVGLLVISLNPALFLLVRDVPWYQMLRDGIAPSLVVVLLGGVVGWLRESLEHVKQQAVAHHMLKQQLEERRATEQALRDDEQRYRTLLLAAQRQSRELALLDQVRTALARELDLPTLFHTVVEAVEQTFGYTLVSLYIRKDDVLVLQHHVGYPEFITSLPVSRGVMGRVARTGQAVLLEHGASDPDFVRAFDGIESEVCVPLFDEGKVVGVLNLETVGGVKLGEADLRLMQALSTHISIAIGRARIYAEAQRRSRMLESITDAFVAVDQQWQFTYINTKAEQFLQRYGVATTLPTEQTLWELFPNGPLSPAYNVLHQAMITQLPAQVEVYSEQVQNWLVIHAYPSPEGLSIYLQDITARKQAEDERLAFDRKLQETAKLESLGVLAGGIAHDFNNLLMAIMGNAGLALLDLAPDAAVRSSIEHIELATQRAADLTRQLLAYAGQGQFVVQQLDLTQLVRELMTLLHTSIAKTITLRDALAPQLPLIEADATQIRQVVMNLVINASEAIGDHHGTITVTTSVREVDQDYLAVTYLAPDLPAGPYVCFEVADNGCGMDEATITKIFDPFFTTKFTGRGLGLAAVLGIVRSHRGALKVESTPGQGTSFTFLLPAVLTPAQPILSQQPTTTSPSEGVLLVVDDEPGVRLVATRMLTRCGWTVLQAADGPTAIELFRTHADTIVGVLLDLNMPEMGGAEIFRMLCQIKPSVRVVLMSGYSEQEIKSRFAHTGIAGFLAKPFIPKDLQAAMQQALHTPVVDAVIGS